MTNIDSSGIDQPVAQADQIPPPPPPQREPDATEVETPEGQIAWPTGSQAEAPGERSGEDDETVAWPTSQDTIPDKETVAPGQPPIVWPMPEAPHRPSSTDSGTDGRGEHGQPTDEDNPAGNTQPLEYEALGRQVESGGELSAAGLTPSPPAPDDTGSEEDLAAQQELATPATAAADANTDQHDAVAEDRGSIYGPDQYKPEELTATGQFGTRIKVELFADADGDLHCPGDARGTWRHANGTLHDKNGFATDTNKPPKAGIDAPATELTDTAVDVPTDMDSPTAAAVRQAVADRDQAVQTKDDIWTKEVEPIAGKLRDAGLAVDRNTFGSDKFNDKLRETAPDLTARDRILARSIGERYSEASTKLVRASERLGEAGADHAVKFLFPNATAVTTGDKTPGKAGTLDRILNIPGHPPAVVVVEDKGAGSTKGTRNVPNPQGGKPVTAEQCSPEYVSGVMQIDRKLAAALRDNPSLRPILQATVNGSNGGLLRCLLAHTSAKGRITITEYFLDPRRLRRHAIRLPGTERTQP